MNKKPICLKCKKAMKPKDPDAQPRKPAEKKVYFMKENGTFIKAYSSKRKANDAKGSRVDPSVVEIIELPLNA